MGQLRKPQAQLVKTQVTGRSTLGKPGPEGAQSLQLLQLRSFPTNSFPTTGLFMRCVCVGGEQGILWA